MAIAQVLPPSTCFPHFLLRGPVETKYAGVRLELPWDKMVTFTVGLPLFLISLSFAQEVSVGSQITCFAPQNFSQKQAAYVDSFCWAAVQHEQSAPLWLHKFFPYVLLLMAILVYIPTLIWRFTAAPQLSSDLKFIMVELDRFYNRAIELAKKQISSGSTDSPESPLSLNRCVLAMTRGCLKYPLVEHYLKSKRSSRSLLVKYLICRGLTFLFLLLACAFLRYYIHLASLSDEFSCDLRTGVLQNDSVLPSAVQCKLVAVGVFGLLSKINLGMYAFLSLFVVYAVLGPGRQSSSFLRPYEILPGFGTLGAIMPFYNDLSIYLLFLKENLSHVESFKRLQVLELLQKSEEEGVDTMCLLRTLGQVKSDVTDSKVMPSLKKVKE
uniref:Pannexin n=1 Tax=Tetraodon nigroviridis TaxID=99883 RepID=H3CL66_TETNG